MYKKLLHFSLFILTLMLLQHGIVAGKNRSQTLRVHSDIIENNDIDPATLFYMESSQALAAEKAVRQSIKP